MAFTSVKALLLGILFVVGGSAWIVGEILVPGLLYGASLSGLWGLFAPFLLILLGAILVLGSTADIQGKKRSKKQEKSPPPPPPQPS